MLKIIDFILYFLQLLKLFFFERLYLYNNFILFYFSNSKNKFHFY